MQGCTIGSIVALAAVVNGGQAFARQMPACTAQQTWTMPAEPPLADSPPPAQTPASPPPPFLVPPPTPLGPDETSPFPGMPSIQPQPADPPAPVVYLRVRAPGEIQPDKEIEYRLTIENTSPAEAHHVVVRDRLPAGTRFVRAEPKPSQQPPAKEGKTDLLWDFGTLKAGERKTIVLAIDPAGKDDIRNSAYVQFEHGQMVRTRISKPSLSLRAIVPPRAILPDAIPFRLEVTNTGTLPAKEVVLKEELPEGLVFGNSKPPPSSGDKPLVWKLGTLKPGEKRAVEYQAIAARAGTFTDKAEVSAEGGVRQQASASVTVGEAKLAVSKTGPLRRLVNRPTPYRITVSNFGTMPATNVQVSDELKPGVDFVGADGGGRLMGGEVRWSLGALQPGERRSLQVVLRAARPGRFGNMVRVRADRDASAQARAEETLFEAAAGPAVEIDKSADPIEVGQKAIYTIRLINPGETAVYNPIVKVTMPEELAVLSERGPTAARRDGRTIRFEPLKILEPRGEAIYTVEAEARKAGEARLRVELTETRKDLAPPVWEEKTIVREKSPRR